MADPIYNGQASAVNRASWFGSWFGGSPAYKSAPLVATNDAPSASASAPASTPSTNPNDPASCSALLRPIVIVVPREVIEVPCEDTGTVIEQS